jgi:1,2-dihydroxy-3-keto-5-methylthiopentene dioxygenase
VPGIDKDTSSETILAVYARQIERVQQEGGFTKVDVVNVHAATPGLETMLSKFSTEHWHDEDEVRLTVHGRGLYHVHPPHGPVLALEVEVEPGDLIRVPRGTLHWFTLCGEREIKAVRFFQDPAGWTPHYNDSQLEKQHEPVCFGPSYVEPEQRMATSWPAIP